MIYVGFFIISILAARGAGVDLLVRLEAWDLDSWANAANFYAEEEH
jgi:hypothetical protein